MRTGDVGLDRDAARDNRRHGGSEAMVAQTLLQFFPDDQARAPILGIERCIDLQTIEIVVFELDVRRAPRTRSAFDANVLRIY